VIASLAAAAVALVLLMPAAALARTYTWSMPGDFTATGSGSNPDHDHYGGTPWRYLDGTTLMGSFGTGIRGGLAGWSTSGDPGALVGVNATGSPISNGGDTFPAGQAVLAPGTHPVAIEWVAPASGTFSVTGTVQGDGTDITCLASGIGWSLNVNGTPKQTTSPISQTLTLNAGDKVDLVASRPLLGGQPCDVASATLQIHQTVSAPAPTTIGKTVTLARRGAPMVSVAITCLAPAGQTCTGDVLVLTSKRYKPVSSGPSGQLRVLFAYVTIAGAKTMHVSRRLSSEVARVLRRKAPLKVTVSAVLSTGSGSPLRYSAARTLRFAS
jgi:hypothetical protein